MTDGLTGLFNRRGWEALLAKEYHRCQRYGFPTCLFSIDLDDFKFVNLAVECDQAGALALNQRLEQALNDTQISASIGMAMRHASGTLEEAFEEADQQMYACKQCRKAGLCR